MATTPAAISPFRSASRVLLEVWNEDAVIAMARNLRKEAGGASIAFVFCSPDWRAHTPDLLEILQVEGHARQIVGCSALGLAGTAQEDDGVSGCSVLFINAPGAGIKTWFIDENFQLPPHNPDATTGWILLGNPLRLNAMDLLNDMNRVYPNTPVYGGMASGGWEPDKMFLLHEAKDARQSPGILIQLTGLQLSGIVSQGCQPIGEAFTVTKVHEDLVLSVGGRPAYDVLRDAVESLTLAERSRAAGNIMAGLAVTEYRDEFTRGDFLIRNILGGDQETGALRLGGLPRVGQTIQFQLREKDSADADLRMRCTETWEDGIRPSAALLFTCGGRGQHLFGIPNHDAGLIADTFGPIPLAGFYANGEFGPVCGINAIHGYTASILMMGPL